eukprot:TRINITY_DN6695_c0_g2_i1.p1 TRINITY_DN6695_c0_g2~~TRINITY_DN6695_c0_g2_i1.p1  ORF type:complete len:447 (+),score=125.23 TRINITY_DN6695_c0_g2_i1:106-1446(+)
MIRRPPRSTLSSSSAASDVYKRQEHQPAEPEEPAAPSPPLRSPVPKEMREVQIAMTVTQLQKIWDVDQTFDVSFYLQLCWEAQEDGETWEPYIEWRNAITTEVNTAPSKMVKNLRTGSFREGGNDVKQGDVLRMNADYTMKCAELYELEHFPTDYQKLHLCLVSDTVERIRFVPMRAVPAKLINHEYFTQIHWQLHQYPSKSSPDYDPACTTMVDTEFTCTPSSESATGQSYTKVVFRMFVSRKSSVWLTNTVFPLTMITSLCFTQFAIPSTDVADRLSVSSTLLLSLVAMKYTVSDKLPDIPYLTTLDLYLFMCMFFTVASGMESAFLTCFNEEHRAEIDTVVFACGLIIWVVVNLVFYTEIGMRNAMLRSGDWVERSWGHRRVWKRLTNVVTSLRSDPKCVMSILDLNNDGVVDQEELGQYIAAVQTHRDSATIARTHSVEKRT